MRALLRLVLLVVLAVVAGLLALVGAATVTPLPMMFVGAGVVVLLGVMAAGVRIVARRLPGGERRTRLAVLAAGAVAGVTVFLSTGATPAWIYVRPVHIAQPRNGAALMATSNAP